jgi:hypothetical protein
MKLLSKRLAALAAMAGATLLGAFFLYGVNIPSVAQAQTGIGLKAEYFKGIEFNALKTQRADAVINFASGTVVAPVANFAPEVGTDTFSARWTGHVVPEYSETYTFYTQSDDGVRLWVNGQPIINNWTPHKATEDSGTVALKAGEKYDLWLEYFQGTGGAQLQLAWSSPSQEKQVIPASRFFYPEKPINHPPSVRITSPASGAALTSPSLLEVAVEAGDPDGKISKVEFFHTADGVTTKVGEDTSTPYGIALKSLTETFAVDGYQITAKATDNKGAATISVPTTVHTYDVKPGSDYFIIGVWAQPRRGSVHMRDGRYKTIDHALWKSRGINTLVGYEAGPSFKVTKDPATGETTVTGDSPGVWTASARNAGLKVIREPVTNGDIPTRDSNTDPLNIEKLKADYDANKDILTAWMHADEPDLKGTAPSWLLPRYQAMKQAVPTLPVKLNFVGNFVGTVGRGPIYQSYAHVADWLSHDTYPANNNQLAAGQITDIIGRRADLLHDWSAGKPEMVYIECSDQHLPGGTNRRGPTPGEMRAQIWDAVIHGVQGVLYFPQRIGGGFNYDNMSVESPELEPEMIANNKLLSGLNGTPGTRLEVAEPFEACTRSFRGKTHTIVLNLSSKGSDNGAPGPTYPGDPNPFRPYEVRIYSGAPSATSQVASLVDKPIQ